MAKPHGDYGGATWQGVRAVVRFEAVCSVPGCSWTQLHTTPASAGHDAARHANEWHESREPGASIETLERTLAQIHLLALEASEEYEASCRAKVGRIYMLSKPAHSGG